MSDTPELDLDALAAHGSTRTGRCYILTDDDAFDIGGALLHGEAAAINNGGSAGVEIFPRIRSLMTEQYGSRNPVNDAAPDLLALAIKQRDEIRELLLMNKGLLCRPPAYPEDGGLQEQVRDFDESQTAGKVLVDHFFPDHQALTTGDEDDR